MRLLLLFSSVQLDSRIRPNVCMISKKLFWGLGVLFIKKYIVILSVNLPFIEQALFSVKIDVVER